MHGSFHLRKSGWRVPKLKPQHSANSNTVIQDSESDSNSSCDPEVSIENSVWDIIPNLKNCMYLHQCVLHVKEVNGKLYSITNSVDERVKKEKIRDIIDRMYIYQ